MKVRTAVTMATSFHVLLEAERMSEEDEVEVEGLPEVEVQPVVKGEHEEGVGAHSRGHSTLPPSTTGSKLSKSVVVAEYICWMIHCSSDSSFNQNDTRVEVFFYIQYSIPRSAVADICAAMFDTFRSNLS